MAVAQIVLGGSLDIATQDEVKAAVKEGGDSLFSRLNGARGRVTRIRIPKSINNLPSSTGTFVLDFGSPAAGKVWYLSEIVVAGTDDRTTIASALASLYIGTPARQVGTGIQDAPIPGSLVRPGQAVPSTFIFDKETMFVHDSESLFVIFYSSVTAVTTLQGVATCIEMDASAVLAGRM